MQINQLMSHSINFVVEEEKKTASAMGFFTLHLACDAIQKKTHNTAGFGCDFHCGCDCGCESLLKPEIDGMWFVRKLNC